jgi:hypothetical protein
MLSRRRLIDSLSNSGRASPEPTQQRALVPPSTGMRRGPIAGAA